MNILMKGIDDAPPGMLNKHGGIEGFNKRI